MHFCNLRCLHDDPLLTIDNNIISVVKEAKFVGILFDNKLSFIPHLRNLRAKCMKALNLLQVVAHRDWGRDFLTLIILYRCFIRSNFDYGCIVLGSARKSYIQMLDPIQNRSLRQQIFKQKPNAIPTFGIRVDQLLLNTDIDLDCTAAYSLTTTPPWTIQLPTLNVSLNTGNKSSVDPKTFKVKFYDVLNTYPDFTHIYTDGSKDGDRVACAAVCGQSVMKEPSTRLADSIFCVESQPIMLALDFSKFHNTTNLLGFLFNVLFASNRQC